MMVWDVFKTVFFNKFVSPPSTEITNDLGFSKISLPEIVELLSFKNTLSFWVSYN